MAKEPSSHGNIATSPPSPSSAGDSFIGSYISVMSKSEIRYEGVLYFLNPQDSTFGLKDVRSFGTEGRRNDGQEVPPSDKVFEYILFRGSDIKDLKVITNPPVQKQEKLHNDPAIIESNYHIPPSSSSHSVSAVPGYSTESKLYSEPTGLNARSYSNILPSNPSGSQMGWGSSQPTHSGSSSYDIPTQWQGYCVAPGSTNISQQRSLSSTPMMYPLQNQTSTTMAVTNISDIVPSGYQLATSSCSNLSPNPTSEQLPPSMPFVNSLSSKQSQPLYTSTLTNSKGLTQPFPLAYQNAGQISNSSLGAPNLSQCRLSEYSLSNNLYAEQKDSTGISSNCINFLSSAPAVQPPLLPLPPASQKLQSPLQFTEEFDFEAMNEKFKKDEVWGYLGKANQREIIDGMQSATSSQEFGDDKLDLIAKSDPKTFGYFQRRNQYGYSGQRAGHGQHRGPYNWGRGYNYGYRGQGRYM